MLNLSRIRCIVQTQYIIDFTQRIFVLIDVEGDIFLSELELEHKGSYCVL